MFSGTTHFFSSINYFIFSCDLEVFVLSLKWNAAYIFRLGFTVPLGCGLHPPRALRPQSLVRVGRSSLSLLKYDVI